MTLAIAAPNQESVTSTTVDHRLAILSMRRLFRKLMVKPLVKLLKARLG